MFMESNNTEKKEFDIIDNFTVDGKFNLASALKYLQNVNKYQEERILALEEAVMFFSDWFNKTQRKEIILPDNVDESGNTKLIL